MSQKLQEAIAAARAGNTKDAQRQLADILQENPNEVHAWFLLSHLVDSETKQKAYLQKVVTLDPTHAKARQRLAQLQAAPAQATAAIAAAPSEPEPLPVSSDAFDFEAQADANTIPEWMADDAPITTPTTAVSPTTEETADDALDIPDWLQVSLDEPEEAEAEAEEPTEKPADAAAMAIEAARQAAKVPAAPAPEPDPDAVEAELARLNRVLMALVVAAVLILLLMAYLFFL
jgi:hypothetical protein